MQRRTLGEMLAVVLVFFGIGYAVRYFEPKRAEALPLYTRSMVADYVKGQVALPRGNSFSSLALSSLSTGSITSDTTATNATSSVGAFTIAPTATLDAGDLILDVKTKSVGGSTVAKIDLEGDTTVATLTTNGAIIAGGVGSAYLGARHSSGYVALWGNVTPSASNYMIGGGTNGDTDINASTGQGIGFNVNNSQVGLMNATALKLAIGMTKSRGAITMSGGTGTATVTATFDTRY